MLAAEALGADCFLSILTAAIRGPGPLEGFAESPLHGRRGTDSGFPAVWHLLLSWTRELEYSTDMFHSPGVFNGLPGWGGREGRVLAAHTMQTDNQLVPHFVYSM